MKLFRKKRMEAKSESATQQNVSQSEQNKATFLPNEEIPVFEQVEETPFTLMEKKDGVRILCGNAIISKEVFANTAEAKRHIYKCPYQLVYAFLCFAIENLRKTWEKDFVTKK